MGRHMRQGLVTAAVSVVAAVAGLVVAAIVTWNLHIYLGVEDGYLTSPTQVLERSPLLLGVDVVLALGAPILAVVLVIRFRRGQRKVRPPVELTGVAHRFEVPGGTPRDPVMWIPG